MTRGHALMKIYSIFNASHNADINIVALNKVLDDFCNSNLDIIDEACSSEREWVGLTDEEIWTVLQFRGYSKDNIEIAKTIEAKLKEKNT